MHQKIIKRLGVSEQKSTAFQSTIPKLLCLLVSGCAVEMGDNGAETDALANKAQEIHRGLDVGSSANDDPHIITSVVRISGFERWYGDDEPTRAFGSGCSAVVLANDVIVTAAHCLDKEVGDNETVYGLNAGDVAWVGVTVTGLKWRVLAGGVVDRSVADPYSYRGWFLVSMHHDYEINASAGNKSKNDVAVMVALEPQALDGLEKAGIWDESIYTGMNLDIYGWGANSDTGSGSGVLRKGHDNSQLRVDSFNSLAFKGSSQEARVCKGDSGGPALRWHANVPSVIGVSSQTTFSDSCTKKNDNAQRYTRLSGKRSWIEGKIGRTCSRPHGEADFVRCPNL